MNILIVNQEDVGDRSIFVSSPEDVHHLVKVLRAKVGDVFPVSDGSSWEYLGRIEDISPEGVTLGIVDKQRHGRELSYEVSLFQGVPKSPKLELIVRKAVELGVSEVIPVFMDRCVAKESGKEEKKIQRLQKIADEAVKQCLSPRNPKVSGFVQFKEMTRDLQGFDLIIFPYENEEGRTIKDLLRKWKEGLEGFEESEESEKIEKSEESDEFKHHVPRIAVVIGPEGGFSTKEVNRLESMGISPVSLGKSILRTETAGHAVLSMLLYEMEL